MDERHDIFPPTNGTADVHFTGNPQITHFKASYRRHTNFAMTCRIILPVVHLKRIEAMALHCDKTKTKV